MTYLHKKERIWGHAPFGWGEVVVGYDFGILTAREIQEWVRGSGFSGPAATRLAGLDEPGLIHFEESLWAACRECTGWKVPRPGHRRWAQAQDAWRILLLREALDEPLSDEDFTAAVANVIDRVGGPEDMLDLLRQTPSPSTDRNRVEAFLRNLEGIRWATAS